MKGNLVLQSVGLLKSENEKQDCSGENFHLVHFKSKLLTENILNFLLFFSGDRHAKHMF